LHSSPSLHHPVDVLGSSGGAFEVLHLMSILGIHPGRLVNEVDEDGWLLAPQLQSELVIPLFDLSFF
jgi:hypothetical protein